MFRVKNLQSRVHFDGPMAFFLNMLSAVHSEICVHPRLALCAGHQPSTVMAFRESASLSFKRSFTGCTQTTNMLIFALSAFAERIALGAGNNLGQLKTHLLLRAMNPPADNLAERNQKQRKHNQAKGDIVRVH